MLVVLLALIAAGSGIARSGSAAHGTLRSTARCEATLVHYTPYKGGQQGSRMKAVKMTGRVVLIALWGKTG